MKETKMYKSKMKSFRLVADPSDFVKVKITTSKDAHEVIKQFYSDDIEIYESFFVLLLNQANNTIGYVKISQGGVTGTVVDLKIIAKYIADSLAGSIILAHNHPSGQLRPSQADLLLTKKVKDMASHFDTRVLDHLILCPGDKYYSFGDEGDL